MTEQHEKILEKICEKRGLGMMALKAILSSPSIKDYWILGFLCSKETLIAVFGEGFINNGCFEELTVGHVCEYLSAGTIIAWQYHDYQMSGMTAEERLEYIGRFMEKSNK